MFVWIEWQTVNGARCTCISSCHVYWCWCLRTHFSNIFSIFHVTCSFCTMPLSNATKLNHPRHLHLNTITSRWQCIFFVFFFPMNLRSPTLSVHNLHVHSSIYTYSSNPSILLPLVTSVLPYRTLNSPYAVSVCVCVRLRYDETRNLIIIVVHLDSWKPNMKVKNAVFATMYAFRPVLKEHLYACSFAVSV